MQICARNTVTDVFPSSAKSSSHVRSRTFHGCKPASSYQFRRIAHNGEIKRARDEMERRRNGGGIELADLSSLRSSTYLRLSSLACARALLRVAQVYGIHGSAQGGCLSPDTRTFTVVVSAFYIYIYICRRRRAISRRENCLLAQRTSIVREMFLRGHGSWLYRSHLCVIASL